MRQRVVFLDRDGVLNVDLGYTYKASDLRLVTGAISGLRKLHQAGYSFVVITNQSGVARGLFSLKDVESFHDALKAKIKIEAPEISFLGFMICPHHPKGSVPQFSIDCDCRKPGIKLITDAVMSYDIDLTASWLVGDKDSDIDCAHNAGMKGIQVTAGGKQYDHHRHPYAKVKTLDDAADIIISASSNVANPKT